MGMLAPLYFAGALAIALPIVFHLIRRTPTGRQAFSSLMFLSPSPPRLTRRSRLSNLLLLLLRAAALALLALAFARPFLSSADATAAGQPRGRRVAVLVDTSASMRRGDLWQQATRQAEQTLADLKPEDEAALFFFDRQVRPGLSFAEWNDLAPGQRAPAFRARLAAAAPTWAPTRLGDALATVADQLAEEEGAKTAEGRSGRQLVLVSDLQQGGRVEALQGHQWPEGVLLQVRSVAPKQPASNAGLQFAEQSTDGTDTVAAANDPGGPRLRVRVSNQPGSDREQFTLAWANDRGPLPGVQPVKVYVPAGRSHVARVPFPSPGQGQAAGGQPAAADRLVLQGDAAEFDNTLYVVPPRQDVVRVLYVGDDAADDVKGLRYYLQGALAETPRRKIEFVARTPADPLADADLIDVRLAVVAAPLADAKAARLRKLAEGGTDVLWVLKDVAAAKGLAAATGVEGWEVAEAPGRDFALIARVDLSHPLFAPFADARFADFTKVHFWKHRRVKLPAVSAGTATPAAPATAPAATTAAARVLAWFDDGDPFLLERPVGQGRVLVATSGWHPIDSQFALSTKFVPLLDGLIRRRDGTTLEAQHYVYEPIALPARGAAAAAGRALLAPSGRRVELAAATATAPEAANQPGIYKLVAGGRETPLAVNLPADESRTAPVAVEEMERYGAKLGTAQTAAELVERQRQLRQAELESRQKLWRWVILGVLGLLVVETLVAGRLARRPQIEPVPA